MSSNTAIRIIEQEDGTWEALKYDVDQGADKAGGAWLGLANLDVALDLIRDWTSEYGLEIVRLKDQLPRLSLSEAAEQHVVRLVADNNFGLPFTRSDVVQAFISGGVYEAEE